jgi:hypothetical protein
MSDLICAICPTYNRPDLLSRAIACFAKQTYENKFLIIVDDAGQYDSQGGDQWSLASFTQRVLSLGEKNNVCAALAPRETRYYAKWDDDDIYMPWHLEALVEAFSHSEFVQPRLAVDYWHGRWAQTETFSKHDKDHYCYHGCWGYTRDLFTRVGGYRSKYAGDDGEFQDRLRNLGVQSSGLNDEKYQTSYWYNRPLANRISERGASADAYFNEREMISYVGSVPAYVGEPVWERPIPSEIIPRQW